MGKFKKGLFFGGLLGASTVWMSTTKKGREVRDKMFDQAADVYVMVKDELEKIGALDKISKQKYVAKVREVVDKYAVKNGLADKTKKTVVKLVSTQWKELQKNCCKSKAKGKCKK